MQRLIRLSLIAWLIWETVPARGADPVTASISDLRLVAYGTLQKQKTGTDAARYVLVDKGGQTTYQILPTANVALDSHVGKQVEVVGKFESGQQTTKKLNSLRI